MATRKGASNSAPRKKPSSGSDPKSKRTVHNKMESVMHEFKHHELKSSTGERVKNPRQAIAIGLSEARRSGADIPPNPNQAKGKKAASSPKQATGKKAVSKKAAPEKRATKSAANRKSARKKRSV